MNLIKYLLSFIIFIGTTIFSGLEFFMWTSNSNITTSNLDRTDKLIPFTYFDLESTNEKFKKRSNMDNNENSTQLYVPMNTSDLPEIFKTTTETFLEISQEMHNPNNTDLLYFIFSQNFFNLFVNDLGELRKIRKENTKKVGKIESKIIEKFSWCLKKLNLKKSEYKMTLKKKEKLEKKFDRFVKNKYKKIFLDHPKYNVKYSYKLYEIFDDNIKILNKFYDLIKESMVEIDCAYKYADILFEVFVYDHVFDMGRIHIKKVVSFFKQFQPEKNIPKFDKFDLSTLAEERDKRAESLEKFYSKNFITKEFLDKRKEYDKKTIEIIEKIVNELRYYRSNLPVTKFKMARFVRNLEDIPFIS